jgi:hypothetical protein
MLVLLSTGLASQPALAQPAGIDPEAQKLLRASLDYLAAQKRFTVDTRSTIEVVLTSGQKLQFGNTVSMAAQRPNKLWAKRYGDLVDQVFYYDGKTLTLHNPGDKVYARVDAPGTIEEMLDHRCAIKSISTSALRARAVTPMQVRAGNRSGGK